MCSRAAFDTLVLTRIVGLRPGPEFCSAWSIRDLYGRVFADMSQRDAFGKVCAYIVLFYIDKGGRNVYILGKNFPQRDCTLYSRRGYL
jgi:hypothetical protein